MHQVRLTRGSELNVVGQSAGIVRISGRVVAVEGSLVAPITRYPCAIYSASVSNQRQDGVHQPPVAYQSRRKNFVLELEPGVPVSVLSQDVTLFDVIGGRLAVEHQLSEAPDALRSFMLGNIMPGVDANGHSINYLGLGWRRGFSSVKALSLSAVW